MDSALLKELDANEPQSLDQQGTYIKAFIYGDWGTGKTTLACSSGRPTLLITSGDGGESVLLNYPEYRGNCEIVRSMGIAHIKTIFRAIEEGHDRYVQYGVVVIDLISSICDQYLKNMVDNYTVNKDRHIAKPRSVGQSLEAEGMGDYKFLAAHMRDLVPVTIAAPVDVIWLASEREPSFTDEAKGNYLTRPKLPEKASDAIAEHCHLVGNLEKKKQGTKVTRTINFSGSNRLAAKSRINELEDKIIPVEEFWTIVDKWRNK